MDVFVGERIRLHRYGIRFLKMRVRSAFATCGALVVLLASASAAHAASVTIVDRGGSQKTFDLSDYSGSLQSATYTLVNSAGAKNAVSVKGITVGDFLALTGADTVYAGVSIARPGGGSVALTQEQVVTNGAQAMITLEGGEAGFVRPQYSGADNNAADHFSAPTLTITQVGGSAFDLSASATASKRKIKAGQSVTFTGSAKGAGAGQAFNYSWNFNDGRTAKGEQVKHTFARRGTYKVLLTATAEGGTRKVNAVVAIQVGEPAKSGKNRSGGGTNNASGAPASGVADGASGAGDTAGAGNAQSGAQSRQTDRRSDSKPPVGGLPTVTGELVSAESTPIAQSSLAARAGVLAAPKQGAKIDGTTIAAVGALLLLGLGFASEFGQPGRLRRRLRGVE